MQSLNISLTLPKSLVETSPVSKLVAKGDPVFLYQHLEDKHSTEEEVNILISSLVLLLTSEQTASVCGWYHEALDGAVVRVHEQRAQ